MNNMGKVEKMVQSAPQWYHYGRTVDESRLTSGLICMILSRAGNYTVSGAACMYRAVHGKMIFTCYSGSIVAASIHMILLSICWAILTALRQGTL